MGQWKIFVVDGFIPSRPREGPMFMHSNGCEIWPQILEKAFAKSVGGYFEISKLSLREIMFALTGCPIKFRVLKGLDVTRDLKDIWLEIKKYMKKGNLIILTNQLNQDTNEELKIRHSYSIIDIDESKGTKQIKVRNPLNAQVFKNNLIGAGIMFAEEKRRIEKSNADTDLDHISIIPMREIFDLFDSLMIVKLGDWEEIKYRGQFVTYTDSEDMSNSIVVSKHSYYVDLILRIG